jgi:peptide/nickel transport system permease protein
MLRYILRRVLYSVPVLVVASFLVYGGIRSTYDPLLQYRHNAHIRNPQQIIAERTKALGLDHPLVVQWWNWLRKFVSGDMGTSEHTHDHVSSMIWRSLGPTLQLVFWVTLVSVILAVGISVYSAVKQYSIGDYALTGLSYLGIAMPTFWLALLAIAAFVTWPKINFHLANPIFYSIGLHSTGVSGFTLDYFRHIALPVFTVAFGSLASWSRFGRASMLETLNADYVRTARAKGVPRRKVIWKHAFRNALIPLVTVISLDTAYLFGGLIITERIFSIPGMGKLFFDSLSSGDAPVLLAWFVVVAILIIAFNLITDFVYGVLDPRIRVS